MTRQTRRWVGLLLVGVTVGLWGCRGPEEGTSYVAGTFNGALTATLPLAVEASVDALEELRMTINTKTIDADQTEAKLVARSDQNVRVEVELYAQGDASTTIRIRVGLSGDRDYSHAIFRKIRTKL